MSVRLGRSDSVRMCRLLLIEDDAARMARVRSWMPRDVGLVSAVSGGMALGTLKRDGRREYAGILLDHDLQQQEATTADLSLSGSHLVNSILLNVDRSVAILIHSMNPSKAASMAERLDRSGFWVTRVPMDRLRESALLEWLTDVREFWAERHDA